VRHGSFASACETHGCRETASVELDVDAVLQGAAPKLDRDATGFVAANDLTAIALVEALGRAGRAVPRDASVVGFDGIALTALAGVGLTTIAQPREEMARTGVEMLLGRIGALGLTEAPKSGGTGFAGAGSGISDDEPPRRIVLEPRLVVRTTTGRRNP
jgi:DNA-binding LacI/PurR family transcriptional regulator